MHASLMLIFFRSSFTNLTTNACHAEEGAMGSDVNFSSFSLRNWTPPPRQINEYRIHKCVKIDNKQNPPKSPRNPSRATGKGC